MKVKNVLSVLGFIVSLILVMFIFRSFNFFDAGSYTTKQIIVTSIISGIISFFINKFFIARSNLGKKIKA